MAAREQQVDTRTVSRGQDRAGHVAVGRQPDPRARLTNAMRQLINTVSMNGIVVIGEGENSTRP